MLLMGRDPCAHSGPAVPSARRSGFRRGFLALLLTVLASLALTGCNWPWDKVANQAQRDFEQAITLLNENSANYQQVLLSLEDKLNRDAKNLVSQVDMVLQGAIASANTGGKCDLEYVGRRVSQQLANLRIVNWLQQEKPLPPSPYACQSVPAALSLDDVESSTVKDVRIAGFDFSPQQLDPRLPVAPEPTVDVLTKSGSTKVPREFVSVQPFDIYVNVGPGGYKMPADSIKLTVAFAGTAGRPFEISVHPVTPKPTPVTVSNLAVVFSTKTNSKKPYSQVSVNMGSGLATYTQPGQGAFPEWSSIRAPLTPSTVELSMLPGAPFRICLSAQNEGDLWFFDATLTGMTSDNRFLSVMFTGQQVAAEKGDTRCVENILPQNLPLHTGGVL